MGPTYRRRPHLGRKLLAMPGSAPVMINGPIFQRDADGVWWWLLKLSNAERARCPEFRAYGEPKDGTSVGYVHAQRSALHEILLLVVAHQVTSTDFDYELCGPGIFGNRLGLTEHALLLHIHKA